MNKLAVLVLIVACAALTIHGLAYARELWQLTGYVALGIATECAWLELCVAFWRHRA